MNSRLDAIQPFAGDDIARGSSRKQRLYCDGCQEKRPAVGFMQCGNFALCDACATGYDFAVVRGLARSLGQYIRDRRFGEVLVDGSDSIVISQGGGQASA